MLRLDLTIVFKFSFYCFFKFYVLLLNSVIKIIRKYCGGYFSEKVGKSVRKKNRYTSGGHFSQNGGKAGQKKTGNREKFNKILKSLFGSPILFMNTSS